MRSSIRIVLAAAFGAAAFCAPSAGSAHKLKILYSFCAKAKCADGETPMSVPIMDSQGNLYGTTPSGGAFGYGTVYELKAAADGKRRHLEILHSFCTGTGCPDGANPYASLVLDIAGNLYGVAGGGGASNNGVAFELSPSRNKWTYRDIHDFCSLDECADGREPKQALSYPGQANGLLYDGVSALFGTTHLGGAGNEGAAFALTPGASGWSETVIHDFCPQGTVKCTDGFDPNSALRFDAAGNAYGTTYSGNDSGLGGTVYELSPVAGQTTWNETVIHGFPANQPALGEQPADVLVDGTGTLYGATLAGGTQTWGTAYKLAFDGANWNETVLYNFCAAGIPDCVDGRSPNAAMVKDGTGALYGTTQWGGDSVLQRSVIYRIAHQKLEVFYTFCKGETCGKGTVPTGLVMDASGNMFGTVQGGTAHSEGGIFELSR